jgi:hypothetical protein
MALNVRAVEIHSAAELQARQAAIADDLLHSPFHRPLKLESDEGAGRLSGHVYAVVDRPYASLRQALSVPANWCEVLMLHINTKQCTRERRDGRDALNVNFGRKTDQPLKDTQRVVFDYRVDAATADFLDVRLSAEDGPLSTHDYRIALQATPTADGRSFIHMSYSYAYGLAAKLAMQGYLATLGRDKVGFTVDGGVRGVVERNTMRYYLAIDAYLASLGLQPAEQLEARLDHWFASTEQYPRQLHEMDRTTYLTMKRAEFRRQQQAGSPNPS